MSRNAILLQSGTSTDGYSRRRRSFVGNKQWLLRLEDCPVVERLSTERKDEVIRAVKEMMLALLDKLMSEGRDEDEE